MGNSFSTTDSSSSSSSTSIDVTGAAANPKRVRTEEGTVEERSIGELIEADRYGKSNPDRVPWGMRIAINKPKGTVT